MKIVKVLKETTYYLDDDNIKNFAEDEGVSVEEMKDMLDKGEVDVYDIYYYCNHYDCEIFDYKAVEG